MSIHQPIKLPVTKFSSQDTGAPQLSKAGAAGEIKTIKKACLITGYGDTAPQGSWSMPFEDGNKAVFKSTDPRSTGFCLRIDHNHPKYGDIACYESMSAIDSGANEWANLVAGFEHNYNYNNNYSWEMYATSVSFLLITTLVYNGVYYQIPFVFGDFMSTMTVDTNNCLLYAATRSGTGAAANSIHGLASTNYAKINIARNYAGVAGGITPTVMAMGLNRRTNLDIYGGHLGFPIYYGESSAVRLIAPWTASNRSERIAPNHQAIGGRQYLVSNLSAATSPIVYFIPTDYWLL